MKKIKIIENPSSGRQGRDLRLDRIITRLIESSYTIQKFKTEKKKDAELETIKTVSEDWDMIIVSGGDGTINEVANGIAKTGSKMPIALLATGTVNDFARDLAIPRTVDEFIQMIEKGKYIDVDVGKLNGKYFLNVAAGGLLTHVGYQVDVTAKYLFGPLAYYLEGVRELLLQGIKPINMIFESEEYDYSGDAMLFLVSNSSSIGGFEKAMPGADVSDGYLDVIVLEDSELGDLATVFVSAIRGTHIHHPKVKHFKTKKIKISSQKEMSVDIDGEFGGMLPVEISVSPNTMRLIIP